MRSSSADSAGQTMRVLTLNVCGIEGDWSARRRVLREGLHHLSPDIVTFQETIVTSDYDQVADLVPSAYEILHQEGRSADGTGCSIASRLPFGEIRQTFLHVTQRVNPEHGWIGSIAAAVVTAPEPIGELLLVHLKPSWQPGFERERDLQCVAAARFIEEMLPDRELPIVLLGDLDASPDTTSIRFWKGQQSLEGMHADYTDTWQAIHPDKDGHTFTPRNPLVAEGGWSDERGRRIDYIFVKGLEVVDCSLVFHEPTDSVWASDHFGVAADIGAAS